jgi:peptide subunit release factor 1 (eRF1)
VSTTVLEAPTFAAAQWLMDHSRGQGLIVSCYADTSVSGVRSHWREHLADELRRIEGQMADDPEARRALARDMEVVRAILSGPAAKQAKGMAVFVNVDRDFARTYPLDTPVANRLVVDEELYIVPLLEYLHRQRRYLVVHTDSHHGVLYTASRGPLRRIEEITESVPRRHAASGQRWGKQQATIARHREDHLLHYRKELVREIERAWAEERYEGLMLFGEHVVLEHLRKALPVHLARAVVVEGPHPFAGRTTRLEAKVRRVMADAMRAHDQRLADEVRVRLADRQHIATGPQAVIDAIRGSQVNWPGCLVMAPDRGAPGWRCPRCGSIFDHAEYACPYCQAACQTVNLWQEIALLATRHGIAVHFVEPEAGLDACGGVVAVLARAHPWDPLPVPPTGATVGSARR